MKKTGNILEGPNLSDSAKGSLVGYLFQFEKALLMLSELNNPTDFITIEEIDDIAVHDSSGKFVIMTVQAKHSILPTGTTFHNTSYALWRTFQIWIEKLNSEIFDYNTKFICSTNKIIPPESLLYNLKSKSFEDVIKMIHDLLKMEELKLKEKCNQDPEGGKYLKRIINLMKYVLKTEDLFKVIYEKIEINDNENAKEKFLNRLHLGSSKYTSIQKDKIYQDFYGWITERSKAKWNNNEIANFSKKEFDEKYYQINSNPSIINAIFRTKKELDSLNIACEELINKMKTELYVQQIEDIDRRQDAKERIIKNAIIDFIYYDNELKYIIDEGDYTEYDFDQFIENCFEIWRDDFGRINKYDSSQYTEKEMNNLAIELFDHVMMNLEISFHEGFNFNTTNKYFKNGCFLKLSNYPKIGWHPEWDKKYINKNGSN